MSEALRGIRVVSLTDGPAGGLTGMILADFGAEVVRVAHPDRPDPFAAMAAQPMWQRGQQTIHLDLHQHLQRNQFHDLCAAADVLLCTWRPGALSKLGLDHAHIRQTHPHLVYCHITGFGSRGPMAEVAGYEHVVAAYAGRMQNFTGIVDRVGPVFCALHVGVHACAQAATSGILAALWERGENGPGRLVETSLLQALLAYEQGPLIGAQFPDRFPQLPAMQAISHTPPLPSLYYHPAQAGDGQWLQFGNLLPHLFDNFLILAGLTDVLADPDFDAKQLKLHNHKQETFRQRMLARIQDRSADDWMRDIIADGGIVATRYQTTQQALNDPDIVDNGHVLTTPTGARQLGPLAALSKTPAFPGATGIPQPNVNKLLSRWQSQPPPAPVGNRRSNTAPLNGVTVVELATIIAAPMAAALLADLGAKVIKVEQIGGDPYRSMGGGMGSARVNTGKSSISINLKSAAGQEIVQGLLQQADIVIHNYRPGVPERLGIGYDAVARVNPNVIYLQSNGYGPNGPSAQRPSTHPIPGAAMGGVMYQMGEQLPTQRLDFEPLRKWAGRIMRANEVNPDPNTAMVIATSALLGLVARQRTGRGQQIFVDMFGANAYANYDDFLSYAGKPPRPLPDPDMLGLNPLYRLYACAGEQWLFVALPNADEQHLFVETLTEAGLEPPTLNTLAAADADTTHALAALFRHQTAAAWQSLLTGVGLGCVRADGDLPSTFWLSNKQSQAMGLTPEVQHPTWGSYRRHGPMQIFDGGDNSIKLAPPPVAGQDNAELLKTLGYAPEEIEQLINAGVVWSDQT